ncbi:MAG TPA: response regulator [Thermoanaerobaculia bacterium]|nr:response regulator [Thermoanaerobaculia bacterium]
MKKPVILVVDDDEPILGLMRTVLREFKFDPITASSGAAALEKAREGSPDLILLDMNMPGMSGHEAVKAFQADEKLRSVPILIVSGEPVSPGDLEAIGALGAVQKPFDLPLLIEQIHAALQPVPSRS